MHDVTLTFNKPAAEAFFGDWATAVKLKVDSGKLKLKAVNAKSGKDVFPIKPRTRGGLEIVVSGPAAKQLLAEVPVDNNTHLALGATSRNWIDGIPVEEKPSKVCPTARFWTIR